MIEPSDIDLLQNGAVHLFWQREVLDNWCSTLAAQGYEVDTVDCTKPGALNTGMSELLFWDEQFSYPGGWSGNLDAFNDGFYAYPFDPCQNAALVLLRFDAVVKRDKDYAMTFLDIIERQARDKLLKGKRLLALIQTDDPKFFTQKLGGRPASWNPEEWTTAARGL